MSVAEFCMVLLKSLTSKRSSDELQMELFELIGFDRIELIQLILEHRQDIVTAHSKSKTAMKKVNYYKCVTCNLSMS